MSQGSREFVMYQGAAFRKDLPALVDAFTEMSTAPALLEEDILEAKESIGWEIQNRNHNMEEKLPELLHQVAYGPVLDEGETLNNTLGKPLLLTNPEDLDRITKESLRAFHSKWFTPNRMVLAGVGMEHAQLVDLATKSLGSLSPVTPALLKSQTSLSQVPTYTGGISITDTASHPAHPNPEHMPLTHIQVFFEAPASTDPDIYALATFVSLMGGGGSFSAGGPGKGMYSRIYTSVLNKYGWVESCHAIHHSYADTSLFGITASVPPALGSHSHIADVICDQLIGMTSSVTEEELSRAKNQLKSNLLMSLESKIVEAEDIGRQVLTYNHRVSVFEMCQRIDALGIEDLKRVARRVILGSNETSPLDFGDPLMKPWTRSGRGNPTVLVWGPLVNSDPLYTIGDTLRKWGIGHEHLAVGEHHQPRKTGGRSNWTRRN